MKRGPVFFVIGSITVFTFFSFALISFAQSLGQIKFSGSPPTCNEAASKTVSVSSGGVLQICEGTGGYSWKPIIQSGSSQAMTFAGIVYFPGSGIWNSSGNVGIGTASPGQKLDVNGNVLIQGVQYSGTAGVRRLNNVAVFSETGENQVGVLVIQTAIPQDASVMPNLKINIFGSYREGGKAIIEINTGGYWTTQGNGGLRGSHANYSDYKQRVRYARNTATGNVAVIIGETNSIWSYSKVAVTEVLGGHNWNDSYGNGWTISRTADLSGYTNMVEVPEVTTAYNLNGGSVNATTGAFSGLVSGITPINAANFTTKNYVDTVILSVTSSQIWSGTKNGTIWNGDAGVGRVGIGISSPDAKLDVRDSGENIIQWGDGTITGELGLWGSAAIFGTNTSHPLYFEVANGITGVWTTGGNLGVGTTTPDSTNYARLHVHNSANVPGRIKITGSGSGYTSADILFEAHAGTRGIGQYYFSPLLGSGAEWFSGIPYGSLDAFVINRKTTASFDNSVAQSDASGVSNFLYINSSGNVGIGTTPSAKLDVNGLIKMRNATITQPEDVVNKSYVDSAISAGSVSYANVSGIPIGGNWVGVHRGFVAEQLSWKNYGNNHTIFDASAGTAPNGSAVNVNNSAVPWTSSYPTLMGWNGVSTYGVRVDSARVADSATDSTKVLKAGDTMSGNLNFNNYGLGVVGLYNSTKYQGVFAMGDAYKLPADGSTTGSLYGLAWSHPNAGGVAANLNTHGLLVMENGAFLAAISGSIRARDDVQAPLFYDSGNTGYYVDPAGTSRMSAISWSNGGATGYTYADSGGSGVTNASPYTGGALLYLSGNAFYFYNGSTNNVIITASGNVGIKKSPSTALDVNGTVTATQFVGGGAGLTGITATDATNAANVRSGDIADLNTAWTLPGTSIPNALYAYRYNSTATNKPVSLDNANWLLNLYSHGTGGTASYGHQIAAGNSPDIYFRTVSNGSFGSWNKLWHTNNDGSGSSLDADTVDGQGFSFSNNNNSPTYVWAIDSSGSSYLAARSQLSVLYAASAGTASDPTRLPLTGGTIDGNLIINEPANNTVAHLRFRDSNNTRYRADVNIAQGGGLQFNAYDDTGGVYQTVMFDGNPIIFRIGSTEKMQITSSGTLLVGGGSGKIDAGTVDPPYTIDGKKYATYMASMTGVKEETTGVIQLLSISNYQHVIDFKNVEEGSDLWLFAKTTNLKKNFGQMTILLSAGFDGKVWYKKNEKDMTLTIFGSNSGEVSYRLTAPRFDAEQWGNRRTEGSEGFNLDTLLGK